jgi:hypothetical protein
VYQQLLAQMSVILLKHAFQSERAIIGVFKNSYHIGPTNTVKYTVTVTVFVINIGNPTLVIAHEDLIEFSRRKSYRSYNHIGNSLIYCICLTSVPMWQRRWRPFETKAHNL